MTKNVLILGAGPAGLSLASFLQDKHGLSVKVLEAEKRVGGRCLSEAVSGQVIEYGTCYAITAHKDVHRWVRKFKIKKRRIVHQSMDGMPLMKFVRAAPGPSITAQALLYLRARGKLLKGVKRGEQWAIEQAALPVATWLDQRKLWKIERLMQRVVTIMGYGFLTEVSTLQALRWVDFNMFLTGFFKRTFMLVPGWQYLWDRLAETLDVELEARVEKVERSNGGCRVHTEDGRVFESDLVVNTLPVHKFNALCSETDDEAYIADSVQWGGYTMSLIACDKWFDHDHIRTWSLTSAREESSFGRVFVARREIKSQDFQGTLYGIGQRSGPYSGPELEELLVKDVRDFGGVNPRVIKQVMWTYFPEYSLDAIGDGLTERMKAVQGANRTFHSGSTFSHEAVSNICAFNRDLAKRIAKWAPVPQL